MQGLAMSKRMVAIRQDCCSLIGMSAYAAVKFSSDTYLHLSNCACCDAEIQQGCQTYRLVHRQ